MEARSRVTKETSASGSAAALSAVGVSAAPDFRQHLLRIERWHVARRFRSPTWKDCRPRARRGARARARGCRHALVVETRMIWRTTLGSITAEACRSCVRRGVADRAHRAAQGGLDALWHGGEIGLAVERCENGAAHQGSAAESRQDRSRETSAPTRGGGRPGRFHRLPTAEFVAQIDWIRLGRKTICRAQSALIQTAVPSNSAYGSRSPRTAEIPRRTMARGPRSRQFPAGPISNVVRGWRPPEIVYSRHQNVVEVASLRRGGVGSADLVLCEKPTKYWIPSGVGFWFFSAFSVDKGHRPSRI